MTDWGANFVNDFMIYLCTGFAAQLAGSLLGMGYGTISNAVLLALGIPPALASASANTASFVTTGAAAWFHHKEGNVDKRTLLYLAVPGVIGSIFGAVMVSKLPVQLIKPFVGVYLMVVSLVIVWRSLSKQQPKDATAGKLTWLGLIGGALGSIGGGGWGPIVNGSLVADGHSPRFTVGSANAAKCFVTFASAVTFFLVLKTCISVAIIGLILGGLLSAPLAAYTCRRLPRNMLVISMAALLLVVGAATIHEAHNQALALIDRTGSN